MRQTIFQSTVTSEFASLRGLSHGRLGVVIHVRPSMPHVKQPKECYARITYRSIH